jgi:hypothetical protein
MNNKTNSIDVITAIRNFFLAAVTTLVIKKPASILITFLLVCNFTLIAQNNLTATNYSLASGNNVFIENKGQLADSEGNARPDILYSLKLPNMQVYFSPTKISMVIAEAMPDFGLDESNPLAGFENTEAAKKTTRGVFQMDIDLLNSNPLASIEAEGETSDYFNYYYGHCPDGVTNVNGFEKLIYKNIYEGIDMVFYGKNAKTLGLKYDFIVHPGADVKQIKLKYSNPDVEILPSLQGLNWQTPLGTINESLGNIYQKNSAQSTRLEGNYTFNNGAIGFSIPHYDKSKTLIIDPFFTYYGTSSEDVGKELVADSNKDVIVVGESASAGLPISGTG